MSRWKPSWKISPRAIRDARPHNDSQPYSAVSAPSGWFMMGVAEALREIKQPFQDPFVQMVSKAECEEIVAAFVAAVGLRSMDEEETPPPLPWDDIPLAPHQQGFVASRPSVWFR